MPVNFNTLVTIDDWAGALQTLLNDSSAAISAKDQQAKLAAQERLRTFSKLSPAQCEVLDNIAHKAVNDLFTAVVDDALAAIASRNVELQQATKLIKNVTAEAQKDAKSIQFEKVISALDKAKSAAETLKTLETSLAQPDQNLLAKIKALSEAIDALSKLA